MFGVRGHGVHCDDFWSEGPSVRGGTFKLATGDNKLNVYMHAHVCMSNLPDISASSAKKITVLF